MKFIFALILFLSPLTVKAQNPFTIPQNDPYLSCERLDSVAVRCDKKSFWISTDKRVEVQIKTYYTVVRDNLVQVQVFFPTRDFDRVVYLMTEKFGEPMKVVSPIQGQKLKMWNLKDVAMVYLQDQAYEFDGFGLLKFDIK
jgi:hypothetical protein